MPIQDTPIPEQTTAVQDTAIPEVGSLSGSSEEVESFKALKAAFIENYNTGIPVIESYQNNKAAFNKDAVLTQQSIEKAKIDNTSISEEYEAQVLDDPEIFTETAPLVVDMQDENLATATDSSKQFVDAVSSPTLDEDVKAALVNSVKLYQMLQETTKELDKVDIGLDFSKAFLPFRDTLNQKELTGDFFGNEETMKNAVFAFKEKSFEEQQAMFPILRDRLIDTLGPLQGIETVKAFIEPISEEELSNFSDWWKLADFADMVSIAGSFVAAAKGFKGAFNVPKLLNQAENPDMASEAVVAAMSSDEAAKAMNIQKDTAFGDTVAFDTSLIDLGHEPNLSAASLEVITKNFGKSDKTVEDIMLGNGYLKEGILNTVERAAIETATFTRLSNAKHENVFITGRTENTTSFSYKARDVDGNFFDDTYQLDMTLNDVGQWDQDQLSVLAEFLASPTVFAKGLTRLDVNSAKRLDSQTAMVFKDLSSLQREAVAPLGNLLQSKPKARLAVVEKALREGDEAPIAGGGRGILWDPTHLKGHYGMDQEQMQTYYSSNRLYNNLWRLRNNSKREEMIAFKYKQVDLVDGEYSYGKPFDTPLAAKEALVSNKVTNIFDTVEDSVHNNITESFLEGQYAIGKTLVKLPTPYQSGAGRGKYTHALVNTESVRELPAVVLNRKTAYVPKMSVDGYWFVKEFGDDIIDGVPKGNVFLKTLRYFDNKAEAEAFTLQKRSEAVANGSTEEAAKLRYKNLEDREQEIFATATGNFSHGSGGTYTGARAQDELLFGMNGKDGQRVNAYEAMARNIANVSRLLPVNQWRLGLEQRWLNSANEMLDVKITGFGELPDSVKSTRKGEFLNVMAKQIRDWQGFPSREEQVYNAINQRMYEWSLQRGGVVGSAGAKITGWMRGKDPVAGARSAAFHSLLGWFNPAQLWVQAQGMAIAVSINLGKNLTETLRHTTGLTILGQADVVQGTMRYRLAAKAAGMDAKELESIHRLWKKTGYEDSILQTADHAASMRGHGIAMDALSRAADKGLFFYRHGEFLNRRMAFTSALDDLKAGRLKGWESFKKGDEVTDEALKSVMDRSGDLMLNITKANAAQWQKGLTSVPTQFFQVSAKALEAGIGADGNFTRAERMRILAGQVALYGTAGIPLANLGTNYALEAMQVSQQDIDNNPVLAKSWNDGFWGFVTLGIFDVDVELSKRGSLVRGVTEFVDNWMFSESTVATKLMGAFGATNQRFWDSFTRQMRPLTMAGHPIEILDIAKLPTMPFLSAVSTWRQAEKAVFMQSIDAILDRNGDKTVSRSFKIRESVMAAIGLQLTDETRAYSLRERTQHVLDTNKKVSNTVIQHMNQMSHRDATGTITEDQLKESDEFYAAILGAVDPGRREDIMKSVRSRLKRDDKLTRAINQYIKKVQGSTVDGIDLYSSAILGDKVLTVRPEEGDK